MTVTVLAVESAFSISSASLAEGEEVVRWSFERRERAARLGFVGWRREVRWGDFGGGAKVRVGEGRGWDSGRADWRWRWSRRVRSAEMRMSRM